jgi:hypothetical protein
MRAGEREQETSFLSFFFLSFVFFPPDLGLSFSARPSQGACLFSLLSSSLPLPSSLFPLPSSSSNLHLHHLHPLRQRSPVSARAAARQNWLPGGKIPPYLDGTLAGDYGFDPLSLGSKPEALRWMVQAELVHGRTAMAAASSIIFTDAAAKAGANIPAWYDAGKVYVESPGAIPFSTLLVTQFVLYHFVEIKRLEDFKKPGSQAEPGSFFGLETAFKGTGENGYPGGAFDPLNLSADPAVFKVMKEREVKNGRLAMVACLGFAGAHGAQPGTPLDNLFAHLANPAANNFATNGVSLPF